MLAFRDITFRPLVGQIETKLNFLRSVLAPRVKTYWNPILKSLIFVPFCDNLTQFGKTSDNPDAGLTPSSFDLIFVCFVCLHCFK